MWHPSRRIRDLSLGTLVLLVLFGLSRALLPYIAGERAGLMEDDSYFYAQIAFNSQRYGLFSFDGLSATSGFHPLWGGLLSLVAHLLGLVTQDKALHLAGYLALWFGIVLALAVRVSVSKSQAAVFIGLALLTAPLMETALLTLLLVLTLKALMKGATERKFDSSLVVSSLLIPLTRIDAVPIVLLWLVAVWSNRAQRNSLGLGLVVGLSLHFAILQVFFGHLYTVSSLLKVDQARQELLSLGGPKKIGLAIRTLLLLGLVVWGAASTWSVGRAPRTQLFLFLGPPVAFSLAHALLSGVRSWYFLPGFTFSFWAGTMALASLDGAGTPWFKFQLPSFKRSLRWGWYAVVGAVLILSLYKVYRFIPLNHVRQASWNFVERAQQFIVPEGRIYQVDGSGFTGYWLRRHLINGDGLVNTYEYAERLKKNQLSGYFEEQGICYVVTDAPLKESEKYIVRNGGLKLRRARGEELLRSEAYGWSKNQNAHFVLWRLDSDRCLL